MDNQRSVLNSLTQVLENYQRCGITRLIRQPAEELPPELLRQFASLAAPRSGASAAATAPQPGTSSQPPTTPAQPATAEQASVDSTAKQLATKLTQDVGEPVQPTPVTTASSDASNPSGAAVGVGLAAEPWSLPVLDPATRLHQAEQLAAQVKACRRCPDIVGFRHQTVFGSGPLDATVCFMGEAPGADEDRLGEPFVGKAGQLLTKIIAAMKLSRDEVYILNALKCRPPQNRTPVPEEIDNCRPYVEAQLDLLKPKYIVCLGAVAVRSILQSTLSIGRLRGRFHEYRGAKVVVTYHPSYLLRNESAKRMVWEDMQMLMREMGLLAR